MTSTSLIGWILLLPLLGALFNGIVGRFAGRTFVDWVACGTVFTAFLLSLATVAQLFGVGIEGDAPAALTFSTGTWFQAGRIAVEFGFRVDALSAVLLLIITGVGSLIHLYSTSYMHDDPGFWRYFAWLNLFVFAMLCLVLGDNLLILFLGWEGVGVASWLLIGFWYQDIDKASAGRKAFIVNRVGDAALLLGLFLIATAAGTVNLAEIATWANALPLTDLTNDGLPWGMGLLLTVACVLLFVGCSGKSAQLPLHVWLPDAMAGPTPVSALIHAATMVTAGVYLIARLSSVFALAPWALGLVAVVGAATALFAATVGLVQSDIKKVLAWSTVSQLGFMFLAVGTGSFFAGVFHLMTHAFFKALLFLAAGSVIHGLHGEQNICRMGGLKDLMPRTHLTFLAGCLAIAGLPLVTSGFYSKDEILWYALSNESVLGGPTAYIPYSWLLWGVGAVTAGLTALYMFRLYFLVFWGTYRGDDETRAKVHESPWAMTLPLGVLAVLALVGGFVAIPKILGGPIPTGLTDLHAWLLPVVGHGEALFVNQFDGYGMAWLSMLVASVMGVGGIAAAWKLYGADERPIVDTVRARLGKLVTAAERAWYVDDVYQFVFGKVLWWKGLALHRLVDEVVLDGIVVRGAGHGMRALGTALRRFQSGDVQRYLAYVVLGTAMLLYLLIR